ncbi:MAG: thioredoxin family protein [Planctomycetaceae bacterium]|nr:thioredoxin family protein [Planctomycetaceae bacterium]
MGAASADAGKYNMVLSIGDDAPAWSELPGVDGEKHSLADLKDFPYVVVVFFSNSCDVAEVYEERIKKIVETYGGQKKQVAVVAINVSKEEEDLLPAMKKRAKEHHFNFGYLFDESQQIAKKYGALWTPEFFVLDPDRKIAYMGGYDDTSASQFVKHHYLMDALQALTNGKKPEIQETPAIGCLIKFERKRRRRPSDD